MKTKKGYRATHIDPVLAEMNSILLAGHLALFFQTRNGTPFSKDNVRRKLHSILKKLKLPKGGLHAFRHGRVSDDRIMEWIGHSNLRMTSNYMNFTDDFRQKMASDFGLVRAEMVPIGPNSNEKWKSGQCRLALHCSVE